MTRRSEVYVIDGVRTPILKSRGEPGEYSAADLATHAGIQLRLRQPKASGHIDEVMLGCVLARPDEANIARIMALRMGLPMSVPAMTVQRNCASGMQALHSAMQRIHLGDADVVLAGGVEAMSHAPLEFNREAVFWFAAMQKARTAVQKFKTWLQWKPSMLQPVVALQSGLTDPVVRLSMGQTAEILAYRFGISRQQMDGFALRSHQRLAAAQKNKVFHEEIVPLVSEQTVYAFDDGVRADSTMEALARLRPVFDRGHGQVTAGNSAQISDGAACLLLASEKAVEELNLKPMARLSGCEWAGLDPAQMGLGPVYATHKLLNRTGLSMSDIDYWEINEAFAAQVLACLAAFNDEQFCREELGAPVLGIIDQDRLNIDGGAIACGHPLGMTGARIVLHMIYLLRRQSARRGVSTLCIGGGQGGAMLVEI